MSIEDFLYPLSSAFPTDELYHAELTKRLDAVTKDEVLPENSLDRIGHIGRQSLNGKHGLAWGYNRHNHLCLLLKEAHV